MFSSLTLAATDVLVRAATQTPGELKVDPNSVTPGPIGFAMIFFIGVAVVLLVIDMVRRIRRVNYKAEIRERLEDELREQKANGAGPGSAK